MVLRSPSGDTKDRCKDEIESKGMTERSTCGKIPALDEGTLHKLPWWEATDRDDARRPARVRRSLGREPADHRPAAETPRTIPV